MSLLIYGGFLSYVIIGIGVVALLIFFDRLLRIRKIGIDCQDFLQGVFTVLDKHNPEEALSICEEAAGPVAALVSEAITHRTSSPENLRAILSATAQSEIARLESRSVTISFFAQVLPLLGLIGTLLSACRILRTVNLEAPLVSVGAVSGSLAQALITSVLGLIFAAACYAMHHILLQQIDRVILDMDTATALTLDYMQTYES